MQHAQAHPIPHAQTLARQMQERQTLEPMILERKMAELLTSQPRMLPRPMAMQSMVGKFPQQTRQPRTRPGVTPMDRKLLNQTPLSQTPPKQTPPKQTLLQPTLPVLMRKERTPPRMRAKPMRWRPTPVLWNCAWMQRRMTMARRQRTSRCKRMLRRTTPPRAVRHRQRNPVVQQRQMVILAWPLPPPSPLQSSLQPVGVFTPHHRARLDPCYTPPPPRFVTPQKRPEMTQQTRQEHDALGPVQVPADRYWGAQTQRSLEHFRIGTETWPRSLIRALGIVKRSAALVNAQKGLISQQMADAIVQACDQVVDGSLDQHFPLKIWQTGSGTQMHMNVNEVVAFVASQQLGQPVHPNDHVNRSQSSNDVMPTAMHIAAVEEVRLRLLPAILGLRQQIHGKALEFQTVVKLGRTHMMDAVPMTVGQELSAWVSQLDHGMQAIRNALPHVQELAVGGTAIGTGLNAPAKFGEDVCWQIAQLTQIRFVRAENSFEAQATHDALVELHGALKRLAVSLLKIANDIRILAGGPRGGIAELVLPANEPGSSIMPGKVNPTQAEALAMVAMQVMGNDVTLSLAGSQGALQMNACKPLMTHVILQSIRLLTDVTTSFDQHCIAGLTLNLPQIARHLERSLMLVTALTPEIGYEKAAQVAHLAEQRDLTIREAALELGVLDAETLDRLLQPSSMIGDS